MTETGPPRVALFRYALDPRGRRPGAHHAPSGAGWCGRSPTRPTWPRREEVRVGRSTIDRWIRAWRAGGLRGAQAQAPGTVAARCPTSVLAPGRGAEPGGPERTAAQIGRDHPHQPKAGRQTSARCSGISPGSG